MSNLIELKPVGYLNPFGKFCCTIGNLPSSYMTSLTYEEQLLWLCDYLKNTVIPAVNNNAEAVLEIQNLYIELKKYVDGYFNDLNIQNEINNKLDSMAQDGSLDKIINQNIFTELNNKIDTLNEGYATIPQLQEQINNVEATTDSLSSQILENSRNSKYISYIFCDTEYRQSPDYIKELLTRCANAGFKESQMLITINNDGTLVEDMSKFTQYNTIANDLNIPITSLKVHGNYTSINYQNTILEVLEYFPSVNTVFIFNEQLQYIFDNALSYPAVIKNKFNNVKKVGFTCAYNSAFYSNTVTQAQWTSILNVFDVIGVNLYPSCTTFANPANCSYDKVIQAFNNPTFILPWTKEIWITESGVLPYWQMLELPENYNLNVLTDTTFSTEPQKLFFNALNNCNISKRASKIIPWYLESGMSDPNHELFNILNNIIKER